MDDNELMEQSAHDEVLETMQRMAQSPLFKTGFLRMPPPSMETMRTRYVDIARGKSLTATIPYQESLSNPTGVFQGGFLCAAFDEVFGPLTYMMAGRPVATIELSTSFLRPFRANDRVLTVRAEVVSRSRSHLMLKAEAKRTDGKLVAVAQAHCLILHNDHLAKLE